MDKRERLKKFAEVTCCFMTILANIALFLCCTLVFRGIVYKHIEIIIFSLQMFVCFIVAIKFCKCLKNYFD